MRTISLIESTGRPEIDQIAEGIIEVYEETFPNRIRSYYLVGSWADASAVLLSDIDIRVVFKDDLYVLNNSWVS